MPRVLQIDSCLGILSTGRITEGIAKVALENGWECYIAHGARYVGETAMESYQISSKLGEYAHYILSYLFDRHGLGSVYATRRLIKYIKRIKPDIIHLHCIHGYYLNYRILFEYLNKKYIPIVWTFHDCWAFTGHCAYFDSISCEKWKFKCHDCELICNYPQSLIADNSVNNYNIKKSLFSESNAVIVPVSDWLNGLVSTSFFKNNRILTIHNGIDVCSFKHISNEFLKNQLNLRGETMILGVAAVWDERKGLGDFMRLRQELDDKYDIVLVGLSQKQLNTLPNGIKGLRRTNNQQELTALYSLANIYVNPTYADNFPTTNLEALACGTPVITYDTGGSPEAIDEKTGVVVAQGDVDGIINAIRWLEENPLSSEDCRLRAVQCFDQNDRFMDYVHLYEELIK